MAAADRRRELEFERPGFQRLQQAVDILDEKIGRLHQLHVEAGIEHVGRRHALMQKPSLRPDVLRNRGEEGDDVVLDLGLDAVDPRDIEIAARPDGFGGLLRDGPELRHGLGRIGLDPEPDRKFGLRRPDARHFVAAIAGDHASQTLNIPG